MNTMIKAVVAAGVVSFLLGGCAVYGPPPGYAAVSYPYYQPTPVYVQPAPVYVKPAPVYVQPAPVYVAPPASVGFSFGYWGGHRGHYYR